MDRQATGEMAQRKVGTAVSLSLVMSGLGHLYCGRLIAGLFAEGRVETQAHRGLVVPENAVDSSGTSPAVTRVRDGKAERIEVKLGLRDGDTERVEVVSGLAEGDVLLIGAARGITPGTPVAVGR